MGRSNHHIAVLGAVFACIVGCRESSQSVHEPNVPALREPMSHAPEPIAVNPPTRRARSQVARPVPSIIPPVPTTPPTGAAPDPDEPPDEPDRLAVPDEPEAIPPPPEMVDTPEAEVEQWLQQAGSAQPGCLRGGPMPQIDLPSPKALASLLRMQPRDFSGVAREALVCLLRLTRLTGAEVYGSSAFRPQAMDAMVHLAGGERELGVVAAVIRTDLPSAHGVAVLAMDKRATGWHIRAATWIPWGGDDDGLRVADIGAKKLLTRRRTGLELILKDRHTTREHHLALTTTERLIEVIGLPTRTTLEDGTRRVARLHVRGRGWPRTIIYRALDTGTDGSTRWLREEWKAKKDTAYGPSQRASGLADPSGVEALLADGHARDALWLLGELPKELRESADGLVLRARVEAGRKKHSTARRYWKRAIKAASTPTVQREYGRYLASQKRRRQARRHLKKYLELAPEAADRAEVEAELDAL